jgi:hypothetical protein
MSKSMATPLCLRGDAGVFTIPELANGVATVLVGSFVDARSLGRAEPPWTFAAWSARAWC